jgi:hypothetical protein
LKGILPVNHSFQGGEGLNFFKIGLFSRIEIHMYLLEDNQNQEHAPHCFPVRIDLDFEGILPANHRFQGAESLIL